MRDIDFALRNLRHLYEQMVNGHVRPTPEDIGRAARGLLGPAIEKCEAVQRVDNRNPCMGCGSEAGPYWCRSCGAT